EAPPSRAARQWTREQAIVELLRGRLTVVGPTTAADLAGSLGIGEADADAALLALEADGVAMRGHFSPESREPFSPDGNFGSGRNGSRPPVENRASLTEWCDRRLLARIHRYTLNRLRAEIEPVSPADFMRFLFAWQHVDPAARLTGIDGVRAVLEALDGYEVAADAWERAVLPARVDGYDGSLLDTLSLTGEIAWARLSTPTDEATQVVGATPVALFLREHGDAWAALKGSASDAGSSAAADDVSGGAPAARSAADRVLDALRVRGALFAPEIAATAVLNDADVRSVLADLVARGLVTSDGFGGLRAIIRTTSGRTPAAGARTNV